MVSILSAFLVAKLIFLVGIGKWGCYGERIAVMAGGSGQLYSCSRRSHGTGTSGPADGLAVTLRFDVYTAEEAHVYRSGHSVCLGSDCRS
jgi:hypothetical protein